MPVRCLTGARFTMNAEVLRWAGIVDAREDDVTAPKDINPGGEFVGYQDPITGEILNEWRPGTVDKPSTVRVEPTRALRTIPCLARGIVDGGIRVAGTTERFGDTYENVDYVKMWVPANVQVTKRDRITNIRSRRNGKVIWLDEEYEDGSRPTVFNVNGVTPLFDAFNNLKEWYCLLERANG